MRSAKQRKPKMSPDDRTFLRLRIGTLFRAKPKGSRRFQYYLYKLPDPHASPFAAIVVVLNGRERNRIVDGIREPMDQDHRLCSRDDFRDIEILAR